ncbi:MAG: PH domain-containing protein, partial [bacterium]
PYTEQQVKLMIASNQVKSDTLVFETGGKQQWLPASHFPRLFKNPSPKGIATPNPVCSSVPIASGDVETVLWKGCPSTWTLLAQILRSFVLAGSIIVLMILSGYSNSQRLSMLCIRVGYVILLIIVLRVIWLWIKLKTTSWVLTTERICSKKGVFSRTTQNLELYRIKDISLHKPFLMRVLRRGYIEYVTSDQTEKRDYQRLGAIARAEDVYELLRKHVERQRQMKGVREVDFWKA